MKQLKEEMGYDSGFGVAGERTKSYINHLIINDEGQIVGQYRKLHLFDIDLTIHGGIAVDESHAIERGEEIAEPMFSPIGYLGLSVGFDVRFPELYREMVLKGAQTLLVPSHFLPQTGANHWASLLRSRAIENQCYVVASAQVGQHNKVSKSFGHSMVVDPWGDIIAQMSDREGFFVCELDF
mmetsp:Transcript_17807/g.30182  ORF Transcript_17807/g.30182 Transcript_17807/m.30182 type:complete len:182 (-) Transcript_17807:160-705(-)